MYDMGEDGQSILIVEDDVAIARLMQLHLEAAGLGVHCCAHGHDAMDSLQERRWDLVILDRMLPGTSGMQLLRMIRRQSSELPVPVLMVTALGQTAERVQGLNEGADDYLAKPFEPEELVARVRALLRRSSDSHDKKALKVSGIELDSEIPGVRVHDQPLMLRPMEYRLLYELMKKPGKTRSRDYLLDHVWGRDTFVEPRTVDVTIKRLRRALTTVGVGECVQTVRGMGYRFNSLEQA